jgi:hypothetical protein
MEKNKAIKMMNISDLNTQAQDWIIKQLEKLESIENMGKQVTCTHDKDCTCAICLLLNKVME